MYISLTLFFRTLGVFAISVIFLAFMAFSLWAAVPVACTALLVALLAFLVANLNARIDQQQNQIKQLQQALKAHASKPGH